MQTVKLAPSTMDTWLLLHDKCGTRIYRPKDEAIFLKNESQLKFEDEIFVVQCSAIELSLQWRELDLAKVQLKVSLSLYFGKPSTFSIVTWDFTRDPKNPMCELNCYDGHKPNILDTETRNLLIERLGMLIRHFPLQLRKLILGSLLSLSSKKPEDPVPQAKVVNAINGAKSNGNGSKKGLLFGKKPVKLSS